MRHSAWFLLLLVAALQLACAAAGRRDWTLDDRSSVELYRRPTPPKARIPGEPSSQQRSTASEPPMRLTASDGTGLVLRRLQVRGVIEDPLSRTELLLTFENPHDRVLDGQFELLLPPGAEVERFAMVVGGQWIESEVVEREHARQVYQAHKHTRRDPALLERERGRRFSGRVFPIAPRERKEIRLSYTSIHEQVGGVYRVPLAGLPRVDALDLQVIRERPGATDELHELHELHADHRAPGEDFTVALDGPGAIGLTAGSQALLRVVPIPARPLAESSRPASLSVLVDTSASAAGATAATEQTLASLLAALDHSGFGQVPLEVLAFDQTRERLYRGPIAGAEPRVIEASRARARLGASDLIAALDAVGPGVDRVIVLSDGEVTAGGDSRFEIAAALERAHERGVARVDAIALGSSADLELLGWLVRQLEPGVVIDAEYDSRSIRLDDLLEPPADRVIVEVAGAKQVWPASFHGLRPGQSVIVQASFARAAPSRAKVSFFGAVKRSEEVELRSGGGPLLERSLAVMRVKALINEIEVGYAPAGSHRELVELSKRYGILSDHTAMLVLESERAYAEFGIERRATVAMEDAKRLPVGAEVNRDFTAVVELAPTATRDSAGISLAGTSGTEVIDEPQWRDRPRWDAQARGRRGGPSKAKLPKSASTIERALDQTLQRCTEHAATMLSDDRYFHAFDLTLALRFDTASRIVEVRSSYLGAELLDCVRYHLPELAGDELDQRPPNSEPVFELLRRYRVELSRGPGDPPGGWRLPEVIAFARAQALAGRSGAAGWARFIDEDLEAGLIDEALDLAWTWQQARPGELLPYVSLGRALAAAGKREEASRAFGSLIDLFPSRPEPRRFAGALLESLDDDAAALTLAIDSYRKARNQRPDHPGGYQALALALARQGDYQTAIDTLLDALGRTYLDDRFGDAIELMRRDLATVAAAAILARPETRTDVLTQLVDTMIVPEAIARDWLTLSWETDASWLALQVDDGEGLTHSYGGGLSREVSDGFGPQGFEWTRAIPGPIHAWVQVNNLGPEGAAIGCIRRVRFDGAGLLEFETRPFVIWPGQYQVALGRFDP